jgi:protein-tyrosine-phosphatase
MAEPRAILFVCTGNTCRSVMAEYLARRRYANSTQFESAGIRLVPSERPDNAAENLRSNFGIDASAHIPRDLQGLGLWTFDLIVAIVDPGSARIYEELKRRGVPAEMLVRWKVEDPFGDDPGDYTRCALALQKLLRTLPVAAPRS